MSSGFVASPKWTSRQQDILIHKSKYSILFEVGDCAVIDHEAFVGTIEVKTNISSKKQLNEAIYTQSEFRNQIRHRGLHSIYAWNGLSYDKAIETLWDFVRENPIKNFDNMPDVVCVRGKYFLMANRYGDRLSPPYHLWHVNKNGIAEGQALLGLVASVWKFGLSLVLPWWLLSWHEHMGTVPEKCQEVPWPDDLKVSVMSDIGS